MEEITHLLQSLARTRKNLQKLITFLPYLSMKLKDAYSLEGKL